MEYIPKIWKLIGGNLNSETWENPTVFCEGLKPIILM